MVAQRLSIWEALRQISSMNAKNMASRRGDWWAASSSLHQTAAAAKKKKKMPTTASRKEAEHRASPELPISTGHLLTVSFHLDLVGMEERFFTVHSGSFSIRKIDRLVHGIP